MRLSRILMFPFFLVAGYIAYQLYFNNQIEWSWYLVPPIVVIVALYVLHPQIDDYGHKLFPQKVDEQLARLFSQSLPYFRSMPDSVQNEVMVELSSQIRRTDFQGMKVEDIPEDVKAMCLFPGVLMSYLSKMPLAQKYNKVIIYKHPFPSPAHQEWHSSEVNHDDGVFLFSLEQLMTVHVYPKQSYHIAFHEWAKALSHHYNVRNLAFANDHEIYQVFGHPKSRLEDFLGLKVDDENPMVVTSYFTRHDELREIRPDMYQKVQAMFSTSSSTELSIA